MCFFEFFTSQEQLIQFLFLSVIEKDEKILIFFLGRTHKIRFVLLVDFVKVRIKEKKRKGVIR